jgi:predicted XRE-type DNA-binding protein
MKKKRFKSVWDAIEDTPGEAANMKTRSALMMVISGYITQHRWSQAEAATALGVTQPRISDLMRGKVQLFSIDTLVTMLAGAGFRVEMNVTKRRKKAA